MPSALLDKTAPPTEAALNETLGASAPHWHAIVAFVTQEHRSLRTEWKFYGAKHGWQWKALQDKGTVLYLIPQANTFTAATALPENAVAALRSSKLPPERINAIESAKTYAE